MSAVIELPADPSSVGAARRYCSARLTEWGVGPAVVEVVALLVSEVVTNVVLHARTEFSLSIDCQDRVRVEVADGSPDLPTAKRYEVDAGSGRGLLLLESLSSRHGAEVVDSGKSVWFEVPLSSA